MEHIPQNLKTISVVVPSRDRIELLYEALHSLAEQTIAPKEVIVVDDASVVEIEQEELQSKFGKIVKVIRNKQSRGLAWARYRGVIECSGDYVTHLDDDDLYDKQFIEQTLDTFQRYPDLELLFIGVEGFGAEAQHFNEVQQAGITSFCQAAQQDNAAQELFVFPPGNLFPEILRKVPMPFQRVVTSLVCWKEITTLRLTAYALVNNVLEDVNLFSYLDGPLRDSEWSIYAAAYCERAALLNKQLYLQRCDGQGYSSRPSQREYHATQSIIIHSTLLKAARDLAELKPWANQIRENTGEKFFDGAYFWHSVGNKKMAYKWLLKAMLTNPKLQHLKFLIRTFLPLTPK